MILLSFAVVLFALIHLIPAMPGVKAALKMRLGRLYGPLFGSAALVSLVLIILGWRLRELVPVYDPPAWGRHVTFGLVLIAFIFLGIWLFRGSFRQRLRFPLALAVIFWGTGHLFIRGDAASLILFGGMIAYAASHLALGLANGVRPAAGEVRGGHNLLSIMAGIALYGVMTQLHPVLIGVAVLTLTH